MAPPERDTRCPACGYDLRGAMSNTCPECGGDVRSMRRHPGRQAVRLLGTIYAGALVVTLGLTASLTATLVERGGGLLAFGLFLAALFDAVVLARCVTRPELIRGLKREAFHPLLLIGGAQVAAAPALVGLALWAMLR